MKPTARALVILALFACAAPALAAVNVNTADLAELDTLPGIGPAKAQAIIDYRSVNGPYESKEELLQVDGIGQATYDGLKDLITIDGAGSTDTTPTNTSASTSEETTTTTSGGSSSKGAPLKGVTIKHDTVVAQAPTTFTSLVTDTKGAELTYGVRYWWNFGDGTIGVGATPQHTYEHPGTYTVTLRVTHKELEATTEATVDVLVSGITLTAPGDGSLALKNTTDATIDIGGWLLVDDAVFAIPSGTRIAKGAEVRFARSVTGLPGTTFAKLLFPNGTLAASTEQPQTQMAEVHRTSGGAPQAAAEDRTIPLREVVYPPEVAMDPGPQQASVASIPLSQQALPWAGLAGVLMLGSMGTFLYMRKPGTMPDAKEFDIV